jgi:hypothetical protein
MKSERHEDDEVREALQNAFPSAGTELGRDLWPAMRSRLDLRPQKVPWYDWALAGGLAGITILFPKLILLFAYHL